MTVITSVEDLRVLAKKRVPRMFYAYVTERGAARLRLSANLHS